jgi:predicted N-acyltransferase
VTTQEDVNVEMDLPADWDAYLESLSAKQRHEVRRKLRRLLEAGDVQYRHVKDAASVTATMDAFFRMFVESRRAFLTDQRSSSTPGR